LGEIAVTGTIVSLNPATGEIGVKALGIGSEQRIRPTVIRLATLESNMAAQMALPIRTALGPFSTEFLMVELLSTGLHPLPQLHSGSRRTRNYLHRTLTFDDVKLKVDGFFFEYEWQKGGGSGPGIVSGKPG
jgi:hypothetical protein